MSTHDVAGSVRSILCVEPDAVERELLAKTLPGHRLTFVATAYDAIREINSHVFDIFVLEFWLPDWTGVQLCRQIRASDPRVPVVFCTNANREADRQRAMRAGASAFFEKPVDPSLLRVCVNSLLERATVDSLVARVQEERAIQEELERRAAELERRAANAQCAAAAAIERTAKLRASKAFIGSGGTRANFDRWWPQVFGSAHASFNAMKD
jgi:CheY-like chemotaxis protein